MLGSWEAVYRLKLIAYSLKLTATLVSLSNPPQPFLYYSARKAELGSILLAFTAG